jgi:hypothetical protein
MWLRVSSALCCYRSLPEGIGRQIVVMVPVNAEGICTVHLPSSGEAQRAQIVDI